MLVVRGSQRNGGAVSQSTPMKLAPETGREELA